MFLSIYKSKTFEALFHATHKKFVLIQSMCFGVMCFGVHVFRNPFVSESCVSESCVFGVHVFSESMCFRSPCVFGVHVFSAKATFPLRLRVFAAQATAGPHSHSDFACLFARLLRRSSRNLLPRMVKSEYYVDKKQTSLLLMKRS